MLIFYTCISILKVSTYLPCTLVLQLILMYATIQLVYIASCYTTLSDHVTVEFTKSSEHLDRCNCKSPCKEVNYHARVSTYKFPNYQYTKTINSTFNNSG